MKSRFSVGRLLVVHALLLAMAAWSAAAAEPFVVTPSRIDGTQVILEQPGTGPELLRQIAGGWDPPTRLTSGDHSIISSMVMDLKRGDTERANHIWHTLVATLIARKERTDIAAIMFNVLKRTYLPPDGELTALAEKARHYNDIQEQLREELADLRSKAEELGPEDRLKVRRSTAVPAFQRGRPGLLVRRSKRLTREQIQDHIKSVEERLATVGDDAQLANIDLQNALQRQQQLLQTMSNVSRMLHDTSMAVARNLG